MSNRPYICIGNKDCKSQENPFSSESKVDALWSTKSLARDLTAGSIYVVSDWEHPGDRGWAIK